MFTDLLNSIKENFTNRESSIKNKIKELENKKVSLQKSLEVEFDKQVSAELVGENYNERRIKDINTELIEVQGRIDAYRRQLDKHSITTQEREELITEAVKEYKRIHIENIKNTIRKYELDAEIRAMIDNARKLDDDRKDEYIYLQLEYSDLFPGLDEKDLKNEVASKADILNDDEYKKLDEKYKELAGKCSVYQRFVWSGLR